MQADAHTRGYTPRELAKVLRVSPSRIRAWIENGELCAVNTAAARCGKPRYVVLPHQLAAFEQGRSAAKPKPAPRRRRTVAIDFFPD
jgi:excisionase family DNA binding protein